MNRLPVPAQLQVNQTGAWRTALDFDLGTAPPEFLQTADQLARLAGENTRMRVVYCRQSDNGSQRPTNNVAMHWTREKGWVKT